MKRLAEFLGFLLLCAMIGSLYTKFIDSLPQIVIDILALAIGASVLWFTWVGIMKYMEDNKSVDTHCFLHL